MDRVTGNTVGAGVAFTGAGRWGGPTDEGRAYTGRCGFGLGDGC